MNTAFAPKSNYSSSSVTEVIDKPEIKTKVKLMLKKPLFVTWSDNWADEIDFRGHKIFPSLEEFELWKLEIRKIKFPVIIGMGSNQKIDYDNADDYFDRLSYKEISPEDYDAFFRLFNSDQTFHWERPENPDW